MSAGLRDGHVEREQGAALMLTLVDRQTGLLNELVLLPQDRRPGGREEGSHGASQPVPPLRPQPHFWSVGN